MGANILVVDDEAGPRESLRMILNVKHQVRMAASGQEALEMVGKEQPDLVFLDIRMPEMEGTEVLRRIKEMAPDVEVAMITAYAAVPSAQRAMRLGALDYITKPFGVAEVEAVVERALAKRREEREGRLLLEQLSSTISQLSDQLARTRGEGDRADDALARDLASAHSSIEGQLNEVLRLSSIGEVAAEVAHDLNNFLSTILFRIEIMLLDLDETQGLDPQTLSNGLRQIALAARDGGEALERISALSSSNPYEPTEKVDLNDILHQSVELSKGRIEEPERYRVVFDLEDLPRIDGSPAGLRTVFTNFVINAYHALEESERPGQISIRSYRDGDRVVAEVADNGVGMSEEVLARLPEPFFSTKGEGGTGLGLTVAHKVVAQHHGSVSFDSAPGEGTTVTVHLPISQSLAVDREGAATVMVVDDQEGMLVVTREVLQSSGYQVITSKSGEEALKLFERALGECRSGQPGVVITDLRMPGMQGTELARHIKEMAPSTRIIVLSAFLEEADPDDLSVADLALEKPYDLHKLCSIVGEQLSQTAVS
ncbi:MAG: response regulator [Armatimonadota bacterium]|nr:response regulator [Armatimonadota bacterium]